MPEVVLRAQATDVRFEPAAKGRLCRQHSSGGWNASIVGTRVVNWCGGQGLKLPERVGGVFLW